MSNEQTPSKLSARGGFFLGIGTAAIVGALAIVAVRYDGTAKATVQTPPEPVATAPANTDTFPVAEHIAAMNASAEPASTTGASAAVPAMPSKAMQPVLLAGTIALDPSVAGTVTGTVTVFVIARDKTGKGHPILAKRLDVASFPTKFTLGPGDSMMGGTPPDSVSLEARIDLDHDAMTKEPNTPSVKIDSVAIGSSALVLTLK